MLVYSIGLSDMRSLKLKGTKTLKVDSWDQMLKSLGLVGLYLHPKPKPDKSHSTHYLSDPPCHEGCPTSLPEGGLTSPKKLKSGGKPSPKRVRKPVSRKPLKGGRGTSSTRTVPRKTTQTSTASPTRRKTR